MPVCTTVGGCGYNLAMFIILTHENADFDAVASLWAAHKLYPEGVPILPRRLNRNVGQFLALYGEVFRFTQPGEWRRRKIDEVLLVDTQSLPTVRGVKSGVAVRVIDHHRLGNVPAHWQLLVEPVGCTMTLLGELIQSSGLTPSPIEATLFLLGIHEDTGSLTYDTSTARDAQLAAWLMQYQPQLSVVRRFLEIPLTTEQQELYHRLQMGMEWLEIEGQNLLLAMAVAPDGFQDEISSVAHRLRDALVPDGLLVLVQLPQHVQLVARSNGDRLDVGVLAQQLGGGGHSRAAAAMLMGINLSEARQKLLLLLPKLVKPMVKVAEVMSYGVNSVPASFTVSEAAAHLHRSAHEGYPVVNQEGQLVGLLTRQAVDRTMNHQLGHLSVRQIMRAAQIAVYPDDTVAKVQQLMMSEGWGQIPVLSKTQPPQLIGIVTRTDLLNLLSQPLAATDHPDIRQLMQKLLLPAVWEIVQTISQLAAEMGVPLYFVGGIVRDLLLEEPPVDLDMVVEGDAIKLGQLLQARFGGALHTHSRFGTAKWQTEEVVWENVLGQSPDVLLPQSIDFVTARTEFYAHPTALPEVAGSSIKLDLHRRDFTINTLAIRLDGAHLGQLLDFYGGQRDLEQGVIRVLHSLSFVDDPTRILRAVRFEQRLGFSIEGRTAELITDALPMLGRVTGERIRHEIELALLEADAVKVLGRLEQLGVLEQIHPQLCWLAEVADLFERVPALCVDPIFQPELGEFDQMVIYFLLWLLPQETGVAEGVMNRLRVRQQTREDWVAVKKLVGELGKVPASAPPSQLTRLIRPHVHRTRVLVAAAAALANHPAQIHLYHYQTEWRQVKTILNGHDLMAMGIPRTPQLGRLLETLLAARLDGQLHTEADERAFIQQL